MHTSTMTTWSTFATIFFCFGPIAEAGQHPFERYQPRRQRNPSLGPVPINCDDTTLECHDTVTGFRWCTRPKQPVGTFIWGTVLPSTSMAELDCTVHQHGPPGSSINRSCNYIKKKCYDPSTGYTFCVDDSGEEVQGTGVPPASMAILDCTNLATGSSVTTTDSEVPATATPIEPTTDSTSTEATAMPIEPTTGSTTTTEAPATATAIAPTPSGIADVENYPQLFGLDVLQEDIELARELHQLFTDAGTPLDTIEWSDFFPEEAVDDPRFAKLLQLVYLFESATPNEVVSETCTKPDAENGCHQCCRSSSDFLFNPFHGCIVYTSQCLGKVGNPEHPWCDGGEPWFSSQQIVRDACPADCKPCASCFERDGQQYQRDMQDIQDSGCDCASFDGNFGIDPCFAFNSCECKCSRTVGSPCEDSQGSTTTTETPATATAIAPTPSDATTTPPATTTTPPATTTVASAPVNSNPTTTPPATTTVASAPKPGIECGDNLECADLNTGYRWCIWPETRKMVWGTVLEISSNEYNDCTGQQRGPPGSPKNRDCDYDTKTCSDPSTGYSFCITPAGEALMETATRNHSSLDCVNQHSLVSGEPASTTTSEPTTVSDY